MIFLILVIRKAACSNSEKKMPKLTLEDRRRIKFLSKEGYSPSQIKSRFEVDMRTVKLWISRASPEDKPRKGRPSYLKRKKIRRVKRVLVKKPHTSCRELTPKINKIIKRAVHPRTVMRYSNKVGLKYGYEPTRQIHFTKDQRKARRKFSRDHIGYDWSKTVFEDEFSLYRTHTKKKKRHDPSARRNTLSKYNPYIKGVVAFSRRGRLEPIFYRKRLNSKIWQDILKNKLFPQIRNQYRGARSGVGTLFCDRDSSHTSKSSKAFYELMGFKVKINGPKFCDFNPMEQAIGNVKQKVRARNPKGVKDLRNYFIEEWNNLDESYFQSLIDSMDRRFQECLERNGQMTHWGSNMKRS